MFSKKNKVMQSFIAFTIIGLILAISIQVEALASLSVHQNLESAWKQANKIGMYEYQTAVIQTIHPTASLANVGRSSEVERLSVTGSIDKSRDGMEMILTRDGGANYIEMKIESGVAYGRLDPTDEWTEVESQSDLFAPGGDPLGYLAAVEDIQSQPLTTSDSTLTDLDSVLENPYVLANPGQQLTQYTFTIDGPQYARFARDQFEADMRSRGELPNGINLGLSNAYVNMQGTGEIWVSESGLPIHQIIHIQFPPEKGAINWVEAEIITDFFNWTETPTLLSQIGYSLNRLAENPNALFTNPQSIAPPTGFQVDQTHIRNFYVVISAILIIGGLTALAIRHWRSPKLYATVSLSIVVTMLVSPLLQSQRVSAFYEGQHQRIADQEQQQAEQENTEQQQEELSGRAFNPHQKPLVNQSSNQLVDAQSVGLNGLAFNNGNQQTSTDVDNTCSSDTDTDNDGLTDNVECYETGTWVNDPDTDGDSIVDSTEVQGFLDANNVRWYLDPRNPDTNGDQILDEIECPELIYGTATACGDTDKDDIPDVFDFDNDGDGVPDAVDSAPNTFAGDLETGFSDGQFSYDIVLTDTQELLFIDFQLRPTDDQHLWYAGNVLDWPSNDTQGQIRRRPGSTTADTFLDFDIEANGANARAAHGDVQVNPMLEIKIPFNADNPTGGLPTVANVVTTTISYTNTDWIDEDFLKDLGISVTFDEADGEHLWVYVPLITVQDETGNSPVAFSGRMVYRPDVLAWGEKHQARLIWIVNALVDSCDTNSVPETFIHDGETVSRGDDDAYDAWCSMTSYQTVTDTITIWQTTQTVIQTYEDDFYLTGMSLREDHGVDVAIFAETDTSVTYESDIWNLALNLEKTWMESQLDDNGRFTVFDIDTELDSWASDHTIYSREIELESQLSIIDIAQTYNQEVLETAVPDPTDRYSTTLLYAGEETERSISLSSSLTEIDGSSLTFDFSQTPLETTANLRWAPFTYDADEELWQKSDVYDYALALDQKLISIFTNNQLDILVNNQTIDDYDYARNGARQLAINYHSTLVNGINIIVAIDEEAVNSDTLTDLIFDTDPALTIAQTMLGDVQSFYRELSPNATNIREDNLLTTWTVLANSTPTLLFAIADARQGQQTLYSAALGELADYYKTFTFDTSDFLVSSPLANTLLAAGAYVSANQAYYQDNVAIIGSNISPNFLYTSYSTLGLVITIYFTRWRLNQYNIYQSAKSFSPKYIQVNLHGNGCTRHIFDAQIDGYFLMRDGNGGFKTIENVDDARDALNVMEKAKQGLKFWSAVALVFYTTVIIGSFIYMQFIELGTDITDLEFTASLAVALAQIIVNVISFIFAAHPVGALILSVVQIIDGLIAIICSIVAAEQEIDPTVQTWVCGGITGVITQVITRLIFDQTPLVDLFREDRLDVALNDIKLDDPAKGIVEGNGVNVSAVVTTTLYTNSPSTLGYVYAWGPENQFADEHLEEATFVYKFQTSETDIDLKRGQTDWEEVPDRADAPAFGIPEGARFYQIFNPSENILLENAGINQQLSVYLTEGFNMNAQECWVYPLSIPPAPVCYLRSYNKSLHTDLSDQFVFDILPDNISDFMAIASDDNGTNYRLAWDTSFPIQWDADGDGLISQARGGDDLNDGNSDIDADGLSDGYEFEIGSKMDAADSDCDGLTDYWEEFYGTNPNRPDSDRDGLVDGHEVFHTNVIYPYENSAHTNPEAINICENDDQESWSGGWEIVYDFDDTTGAPLTTWVSADPADPDTDDDGVIDNFEFIYGYNPNAVSSLEVLSLNAGLPAGNYYLPGETVAYTATIKNLLDNRYVRGLLQAEYPIDNLISTEVMETLLPLANTEMNGSVLVDNSIAASTVTSLTIRAGAVIEDLDTGRLAWLHFNEEANSTLFADDSFTGHEFSCSGDSCPAANGNYLNFASGDMITLEQNSADLQQQSFTVGAWLYATNAKSGFFSNGVQFRLSNSVPTVAYYDGTQTVIRSFPVTIPTNDWTHLMFTWNNVNGEGTLTLYVNGNQRSTHTGLSPISFDATQKATIAPVGLINNFEYHHTALTAVQVRALVTQPNLQFDFGSLSDVSIDGNTVTVATGAAPEQNGNKADFTPGDLIHVEGPGLDVSDGFFTFATWIKPIQRDEDTYDDHTTTYANGTTVDLNPLALLLDTYPAVEDEEEVKAWQFIAGNEIYTNESGSDNAYETISAPYPTLAHDNDGRLRIRFGKNNINETANTLCSFETESGILALDSWQYLTVTYNGSQFFIYLNGELIDNGGLNCTGELPTESTELYIGNSSPYGYLYFDRIDVNAYCDAHDCDFGDEELRINIGGNSSANNFWSHDDVTIGEYDLDKAFFLEKSETVHLWEDDGISDDNHFDENPDNENPDDSYFKRTVSPVERNKFYDSYSLGGIHNDESKGILHYGVFDHYFEGELQDFRIYNYTMDGTEAADLYNTNYHALELLFDEPPGEDIFTDISGNGFAVSCDANASICPDSGIPGVNNQTLRFDGEDDVLNFSATTEELSFVNDSFTVMAWVKLNELTGDQTILGSNEFDFDDLVLAVREGQLYMRYGRKSSLAFDLTAVTPISADEWYHFTWIYEDLANDNNQIKLTLYINGEEVASEQGNNVSSDITTPLVIGYHEEVFISDSDERYLDGFIDSLSIARTALISTEIKAAYLKAPVLNLHLDENSGNVPFVDETNNYNDAICGTNCAQGGDMGQMREAAVFDSTSSIIATDNDGLDLSMFTVGLWLKPTQSRGSAQQIFSKEDGSGNDINFALTMPADSFQIQLKVEGAACTGTTNTLTSDGELIEDQWNHFVATYDGITLKAYINGALDNTLTLDNAILACTDGASFILGDESQGFEGSIDEVTAYGTVLSEFEVKDIYNYQSAWFDVVEKLNIIVDLEAPELFMTTGNFIKPNPNVVVALQALDDLSGVALVEYSLDNQTWLPALQESAGSASWSFIFEPTRANGNNRIFLRATDAAGNQSAINRNIRLDSTAPDARINGSSTAVLTEETIQISGSVFDQYNNFRTQSGVAPNSIRIDLLDSDGQSVSGFYTATVTSIEGMTVNWVVDYPVPPTTYGKYTVRVSAEDQAGNVQEGLDAGHLYLDGIGPVSDVYWATTVISETTPYAALIGTATLVGSVHDIFDPFESRVLSMHFSQINRFDSNSGLMIDSSPNRLPTTCINCPSSQGDSPHDNSYGRSAEFNATSNHQVMVENNGTLDLSAFSLSLWVKPDQTNSGVQNLVSQDSNGTINNRNFALFMPSDTTQVTFETQGICGTTGNANTLTTIDSLALGQWSHIGAIYNGDTQEMMIYINGELDNSLTHDTAGICTTTNDIIVGGNINAQLDELIIYNQALNSETVDRIANPLTQVENVLGRVGGVESVDLRFRHAGGSVWPEIASDGIRLFLPMENDPISDLSAYAQTVNCTVCPDQVGSNHGLAAQFDGATQTFSTTHIINPADGAFAVSLWVNPATADTAQPLLVQANGQTWLGINNQNQLYTAIGGSDIVLPQTVSADNWHHIALNYDGTMVTLHLDGNSQAFAVTPQSSTGHLLIGHDGVSFFSGALDELILLARILETDELAILADGESWRDTFVFEGTGTTGTFAGSGDWYYEDPIPSMEGPYSIDLLTKDTWDNYRYIPNAWQGIIDNMGPQLVLSSTNVTSDIAEISCQATDYSLDANSWDCPATGDLTYEYHGEDWFKQIYGTTNQLLSLSNSSQNALVPGSYSLSACDIFGNCSSYLALVVDLFEEDATVAIDEGYQGDVHWGDYDNDDDLDILITGCESETSCDAPIAKVYANTAGAFSLVATLTGQGEGSSLWGDTDNDGDLDIVLSGNRGGGVYNTAVYENTGTGFDSGAEISSDYGQLGWGDFDNDNDLDLSIDGAVYENIGASFVLNEIAILPEYSDQQDWGDYDNDGDLDLLTGRNNFGYIYENNNGQLTAVHSLSNSYYNSNAAWGDYNADGLLDILINGRPVSSNTPQLDIYQNTGAGFTLVQTLVGSSLGSADWGDYDNDGDLDIILTGCDSNNCDSQWTVVYNNRLIVASANATNTMPAAPTGLDETVNGRSVTFDWDVASDTETDAAGLRYNVYVGLVGDESSAYSPMAEINGVNEGWLLEPRLGSLLTNTLSLTVVEAGDYAWSAQAVDGAFGGSDWATEGSFHIDGADLSVTKEVNTAFAQAGDTLVYTITFINNGPDILTDVVLTDTTSANLTNLSYQSSGISVTEIETDPYVWQVAEIESGESGTIVLQGDISGSFNTAGQFVSNGAEISSSAYDHDLQNNIDGAMTYPDTGTICMNYETAVLADAPVGYWRLSDPTSVAENLGSLGSVINGEYVGTTPAASLIWQDPTLAASFDGNDDYIIIPPANGFTGATNEKTIELWLETDAAFGDSVIFGSPQIHMLYEQGSETFGSRGLALFVRSVRYANDNLEHILILSVGGGSVAIGTIESGATHHLAITFDNGTVRSYKDGLEMDTHVGFSDQIPMHHAGDARIGANGGSYVIWNGDTNLYPFAGTIDEVAVYNNALSVDRIAAHFSACQSVDVLVTQSASVSQAEIRDTVSYVLTFANVGYETAVNVTISDTIPAELTNVTYDWDADNGVILTEVPNTTYQWTVGNLASNSGGVITITGEIDDNALVGADINNVVAIATSSTEFNTTNNSDNASFEVVPTVAIEPTLPPVFVLDNDASGDLQNVYLSSVDWGDYDGDGDLDIVLAGHTGVFKTTRIYRNDNGRFINIYAGLPGIENGSVSWGDYNGDDLLDVLIVGNAGAIKVASVYENLGGNAFTDAAVGLTAVYNGHAQWGDYDNDDDLDIFVTGHTGSVPHTQIYNNDGGVFTAMNPAITAVYLSASSWADYDGDGDWDIYIAGITIDEAGEVVGRFYRNDGGNTFTLIADTGLPALYSSVNNTSAWGDYDNDTDLDLLINNVVYRNNGDDTFTEIFIGTAFVTDSNVAWGDYDNDGRLDFLIMGEGAETFTVYHNDGADTFIQLDTETFPSMENGHAAWGDYDHDGTMDILMTGQNGNNTLSQIWRNMTPAITFDDFTVVVDEPAGSVDLTVNLNEWVDGDVAVDYVTSNGSAMAGSDYTAVNGTATLISGTQSVDISIPILDDANEESVEEFYLTLNSATGVDFSAPITATIVISDDDVNAEVIVNPMTVDVTEGGATDSYQISLGSEPTDPVTITLGTDGETTVNLTELVFDNSDWSTPKDVTVTAVDDVLIEGAHSSSIAHVAASDDGDYNGITVSDVTANITDNDGATVTVSPTTLNLTEGLTDTYQIELDSEPTALVTVTLTTNGQTTVTPTELVFDDGNWNTAQDVTVTAVDDDIAEGVHNDTISHSTTSSDINFDGIAVDSVTVNITDNDTAGVDITPISTNVTEGGATDNYAVVLESEPTNAVTITLSTSGEATVNLTQLVFDDTDWDTPQNVTITAVNDDLVEGAHNDTVTHAATSNDGNYNGIGMSNVTVNITDNDSAGVTIIPTTLGVAEGDNDSYAVELDSEPTAPVTITLSTSGEATVNLTQLVFDDSDWDTPKNVTVTAVADGLFEGDHGDTVTHAAASADGDYNGIGVSNVTVNITDTPAIEVSPISLAIAEGGATDSYQISMASKPSDNVTIDITTDAQANASAAQLTFTSVNWATPQVVTITAVDDALFEGAHNSTITHLVGSSDGDYNGMAISNVTASVADNDGASVSVAPTTLSIAEGNNDIYEVVLDNEPTDPVTITIASSGDVTMNPTQLVFDNVNWNVTRTVTVTAVADGLFEGDHNDTINQAATSGDANYNGAAVANVTVNITDTPAIDVSPTSLTLAEVSGNDSYQVVLSSQPSDNVTVTISTDAQLNADMTELVFTTANWDTAQTVTVNAVNDDIDEGAHNGTITHSATSSDADYNGIGLAVSNVTASITDNDSAGINVNPTAVNATEGGVTGSYQVSITSEPTGNVTVTVGTDSQVSTDLTEVVFTSLNWSDVQTVTVTAVNDDLVEGAHSGTIIHSAASSDGNYNSALISNVTTNITDNDSAAINVSESVLNIAEGSNDSYQIVLNSEPTDSVTVTLATGSELNVAPNPVVLNSGNWDTAQDVTVTAISDGLFEGNHSDTITQTVSSTDGNYSGIVLSNIAVNITDTPAVNVSVTSLFVTEDGATDSYQLVLASQPTANVTVTIGTDAQTNASLAQVFFTSANWNNSQLVTINAINDDVAEGAHNGTVTHTAVSSDGVYNGIGISNATANITDNDSSGVTVAPTTLNILENNDDTYDISLESEPTDNVTVTVAIDSQVSVNSSEVIFTSANWNSAQTITVTVNDDDIDNGNRNSTVSHSTVSADGNYNGAVVADVMVNITEDDNAGVIISPTTIDVSEAGITGTYQISLNSIPTDPVTVTVTPDGDSTVDVSTAVFTPLTWNNVQTVTVTAIDDAIVEGLHDSAISHSVTSPDSNYEAITISDLVASVADDDGVFETVTEAISYTIAYAIDIPTNADYNSTNPVYFIDNSSSIGTFDRIAYYMVLDDQWAYASLPAFTSNIKQVGIPVQNTGITFTTVTGDLNYRQDVGFGVQGSDRVQGGIEFWPDAYQPGPMRPEVVDQFGDPAGAATVFDWNDHVVTNTVSYSGSLQIARYSSGPENKCCTIMAWNNWDAPAIDDLGINDYYGSSGDDDFYNTPGDFTGAANATSYTTRTLYVLVRETNSLLLNSPTVESSGKETAISQVENISVAAESRRVMLDLTGQSYITVDLDKVAHAQPASMPVILEHASDVSFENSMTFALNGNPTSFVTSNQVNNTIGVSAITTPTFPLAVTNMQPITLTGFVASEQELGSLEVTIDGAPIYNISFGAGMTETLWTTTWTPLTEGAYEVEANLTNGVGAVVSDPTDTIIYVDLTDPEITLTTDFINQSNSQVGQIIVTGLATDTIGVMLVEGKIGDDDWQLARLDGTGLLTTTFTATLPISLGVTFADNFDVTVQVTDRSGHQVTLQETLLVDLIAPSPVSMTLSANGQSISQYETIDWVENPTVDLVWGVSNDVNGIASYQVTWFDSASGSAQMVQQNSFANTQFGDSFGATEGQKLSVEITTVDGFGNSRTQTFGPVYVDFPTTPVYTNAAAPLAYNGWLQNSCYQLGHDDRLALVQPFNADVQSFFTSWDATGLRVTWQGADWETDGDMFLYLDSTTGGSRVAMNPYVETAVSTAIFLPETLDADYAIWVQDATIAILYEWNGSDWNEVSSGEFEFQFDAELASPQTDLYLPFDTISIIDPSTESVEMVAFASENDGLKLWATMPANNNLNSEQAIGAPATSDVEIFTLLNSFNWAAADAGLCPSDSQPQGNNLSSALIVDQAGVGYQLFADHLIAVQPKLLPDAADWDTAIDSLCNGSPVSRFSSDVPLPSLCQRDVEGAADAVNPARDLAHLLSTDQPPIAHGDSLSLTLQLVNNGEKSLQDVTILFIAEALLTLPGGSLNSGQYEQEINVGTLAAGTGTNVTIDAVVDAAFNAAATDGWTQLKAVVYDATGGVERPLEIHYLNHKVDVAGPSYVELQTPLSIIGEGEQSFFGFVADQSTVPTIIIELDSVEHSCENSMLAAEWRCDIDLGDLNDGDSVAVRVKAVDNHGQESAWFDATTLTVDTTSPTLTTTNVTTTTFNGGIVGPDDTLVLGQLADDHLVDYVEVCEGGVCQIVPISSETDIVDRQLHSYKDDSEIPVFIPQDGSCAVPLTRVFDITDAFTVADLDIGLQVDHPFRNDLQVWLTSPENTRIQLAGGLAGVANLNVLLNDASLLNSSMADDLVEHTLSDVNYEQQRQTVSDLLYAFRGEQAQGSWLLEICDAYPAEDAGWYLQSTLFFQAEILPIDTSINWQLNLDLPQHVEGLQKTLTIYGYDSVGNVTEPLTLSFEVDTRAPELTAVVIDLPSATSKPVVLSGEVTDAHIVSMRLLIRNPNGELVGDWIEMDGQSWSYDSTFRFAQPGTYQIWAEAEDSLGNVSYAGPFEVTRSATPYQIFLPVVYNNATPSRPSRLYLPIMIR